MHFFHIDLVEVVAGHSCHSPRLVLAAVEALAHNEESLLVASGRGGWVWYGYTEDRRLLMSIFDALNINTIATGNFKRKPKIKPWPRPEDRKPKTVAELRRKFAPKLRAPINPLRVPLE